MHCLWKASKKGRDVRGSDKGNESHPLQGTRTGVPDMREKGLRRRLIAFSRENFIYK